MRGTTKATTNGRAYTGKPLPDGAAEMDRGYSSMGDDVASSMSNTADETLASLGEAHNLCARIDAKLFGDKPGDGLREGTLPSCGLAGQIDEGRVAASGLVKRLAAILDRL